MSEDSIGKYLEYAQWIFPLRVKFISGRILELVHPCSQLPSYHKQAIQTRTIGTKLRIKCLKNSPIEYSRRYGNQHSQLNVYSTYKTRSLLESHRFFHLFKTVICTSCQDL